MRDALKRHWPEYLMEAAGLGLLMMSICAFVVLLEHPASPVEQAIPQPVLRRALIGLAVGLTLVGLIYSPWGKRSGAHLNPSMTLAFWRLGKVSPWDAFFYMTAQFAGGVGGVLLIAAALREYVATPSINYAATVPGSGGPLLAFVAEFAMSFVLMLVVVGVSNNERWAHLTGLCAGALVALYIGVEAPLSGTSLNPARTFGSALPGQMWTALWIYFTAPTLGMLLAAQLYLARTAKADVLCAKLHHQNSERCIFCEYQQRVNK
jgi:aquaporin Z